MMTSLLHGAPTTVLATACGMLRSEHDGEHTSAALRIGDLVHEAGPTWFDVMAAAATTPGAPDDTRGCDQRLAAPRVPRDRAALPDWKRDFLDPVAGRARADAEAAPRPQLWPGHDAKAGPDWRLLGAIAGSGFRGFSKLKARIDATIRANREHEAAAADGEAQPMPPWRWHDLRRTARTGMTRLGVPRDHAEAAINHVSGRSKLERTYDRHDYAEEIAAALKRWQAHVAALVTAQPAAEVVTLAERRRA